MKILTLLAFWSCLTIQNVLGQVSGKLTTADGEPLPFATVLVLTPGDSTLVRGVMTTGSGNYVTGSIPTGQYFVRYSAVGYKTVETAVFTLTDATPNHDFGTQVLEEDARQLAEVVVRGEKPLYEHRIDRTVVNVESSVMTKGSSALQVLERSPGVYIDLRNNSISLNGKSSVMVMLNGKLVRLPVAQVMAMLNSMSANDIEKIELLTTPPARYDADGSAGMINIVQKKHKAPGTTGSVSVTAGYGWGEKGSASLNLSHSTGKATVYGSYAYVHDRGKDGWAAVSTQNMPAFGGALAADVSSTDNATVNSHTVTAGLDVRLNRTTLGGSMTYNGSHVARRTVNRGTYTLVASDSVLQMDASMQGKNRWGNSMVNLYLENQFRAGEKLTIDVDYLHYDNDNPTDGYTTFFDRDGNEAVPAGNIFSGRQKGVSKSPIHVGVVKIDYTRRLRDRLTWETGVKGTLTRSSSLSRIETWVDGAWTSGPRYMNDVDMEEQIAAAYTSLNLDVTPQVSLVAGVRYEHAYTHADADKEENTIDRKLGKFFPGFFLSKKLNDEATLQFSYTKRISRPSYNDLASYLQYNDPMSVSTGNPSLKPTVTNNIKVGLTLKDYAFSLTASRDDNPIILYQQKESPARDLMYLAPQNMAYQNHFTLQATLPFTVTPRWTMNYSLLGGLRQFKLDHTDEKLRKTYVAYSLNGSQTFTLPRSFSVELSGWYNSAQYEGSKKLEPFGMVNMGVKKELRHDRGSFQLTVTDLLQSMRVSGYFGTLTEEAFSLKAHYVYRAESARTRIFKITYTRSLGNANAKKRDSRGAVSKDERDRIRKN